MGKNAFVTLATSDEYAIGALVLAQSIRNVGTNAELVILISNGVSPGLSNSLTPTFDHIVKINELTSGNNEILNLIQRPELGVTISKIHAWKLTDFDKCVFLDADCLVIKTIDELFEREELSAVCDLGWPDCFNSGVFVFKPSQQTFDGLLNLAKTEGSFDGGDQGLLNIYFSDWLDSDINKRLSFIYNMHSSAAYTYLPAFRKFGERVKIVHFLGSIKPWMYNYDKATGEITSRFQAQHNMAHVTAWWNTFAHQVKDKLPSDLTTFWLPVALENFVRMIKHSETKRNDRLDYKTENDVNYENSYKAPFDNHPSRLIERTTSFTNQTVEQQSFFNKPVDQYSNERPSSSNASYLPLEEEISTSDAPETSTPSEDYLDVQDLIEQFEDETDEGGIAGQLVNLEMKKLEEDYNRKKQWESGQIDYLGVDSFENIQKKIAESVGNQ